MEIHDLETMIRKFTAGDRGTTTLASLDEAAWDCFHDPWEARPDFVAREMAEALSALPGLEEVEAPRAPRPPKRPESPLDLMAERLAAYLEVHHWDYVLERPGTFRCTPALTAMEGSDLTLRLVLEGPRNRHLCFTLTSTWQAPESALGEAGLFCGRWNMEAHDLFAYQDNLDGGPWGLVLQALLPLPPKVPMGTLVAFLDTCLGEARDFWAQVRAEAKGWPA